MTNHHQNDSVLEIMGRNIRRWRAFREMSGETLAKAVGMDKSQISKIENGRSREVSVRNAEAIAIALGLTFGQLVFTSPQTIIALTQNPNGHSVNDGTQHNIDAWLIDELRQQLKAKDDHIKFLQQHFC